jgi:DNA-binding response OmpR family regulator
MRLSASINQNDDADGLGAILVVDDDLVVKHLLKEWLCTAGYRCFVANTAEQGWRLLTDFAEQIWLVILDVRMPGKYDGVGLFDRISDVAQERNLQVIMMSSNQDSIAHAVNHGCDEVMVKPIVKDVLLKRVETFAALQTAVNLRSLE